MFGFKFGICTLIVAIQHDMPASVIWMLCLHATSHGISSIRSIAHFRKQQDMTQDPLGGELIEAAELSEYATVRKAYRKEITADLVVTSQLAWSRSTAL